MLDRRFWAKVDVQEGGCWNWTANKNNHGYGLFRPGGLAPKKLAHRLVFAAVVGHDRTPCVLHTCDNPACVRPEHLVGGTQLQNMRDMAEKGRRKTVVNPDNKPPVHRGESHPKAKLTDELVRKYRREFAAGKTVKQMAQETGLHEKSLRKMINGDHWSHVV